MKQKIVRIATRKSPLALWQANHVGNLLTQQFPELKYQLVPLVTSGDKFQKDKLLAIGGKGLFVKELEEALLDNRADLAVHSSKDMPAQFPPGLGIAAFCQRDNPLDAFISSNYSSINHLPQQAIVGTASLRRQFQLLVHRPDLQIKSLRGNINTRMAKLEAGEYDAIILAAAGLERMGLKDIIKETISDKLMLPACGQGALAIQCRLEDHEIQSIIKPLDDPISSLCVNTERHVNAQLGGNCHVPLAVYCQILANNELYLRAKIGTPTGDKVITDSQQGPQQHAQQLAEQCAQALFSQGANELLGLSS